MVKSKGLGDSVEKVLKETGISKKKWKLINILSAWKSGKTDLILSDVVKYIESEYIKNKIDDKKK